MSVFPPDICARHRADGYWGEETLTSMFEATARRAPDRLALVDPPNREAIFEGAPRRYDYAALAREIEIYAAAFRRHGLGNGSVVAVQLPNISEIVIAMLALSRIGAIVSPVSIAYRTAELRALSEILDFDAYLSVGRFRGAPFYAERLDAIAPGVKQLGLGVDLPPGVTPLLDDRADDRATPATPSDADDLFAVFWTSGTEGTPKAVPKTHNNMMASSLGAWKILGLPDGVNILAPFPFVNAAAVGGLMMCWMRTAGALVLHHPFDVEIFLRQLSEEAVGYTMMSPTILSYLREKSDHPLLTPALERLLAVGTGSSPPDPETFVFFQDRFGIPVVNFFGSNEGAQLAAAPEGIADARLRAKAFPRDGDVNWRPHLRTANGGWFKLVDPETRAPVSAPGGIGEMLIGGPATLPGYLSRKGFDRSRFDAEDYLGSGDLFEISECGALIKFHSRVKELISRGGMKISPVELDHVFAKLPGAREAAVASYADPALGERVCLFVAPEEGAVIDEAAIRLFCDRAGLARFKWPERLEFCEALPRTPMGKLDRKALARALAESREDA